MIFFGFFTFSFFLLNILENRHRLANPEPMKKLPFVSIIVPAYNESAHIIQTITSLKNLNYPKELFEIIVVDDGSKDNTYSLAKKLESKMIKVFTKSNGGKASAMNFGIKKARGEIIGVLDADSFVSENALMRMIGYFSGDKVMAVTPALKVYKPKGILQRIQSIEYIFGIFLRKNFSFMNAVNVTPGPFSLYRKIFFEKHGGFDENNITEDTEIALRIQSHHYIIENSVDAEVFTVCPSNFSVLLKQRVRWYNGLLKNLKKYSHLLSPKYGYLALFVIPSALLSVALLVVATSYFGYLNIDWIIHSIIDLKNINFDIFSMINPSNMKFDYILYKIAGPMTVLLLLTLILNVLMILFAKFQSRENSRLRYSYIFYMLFYSFIYSVWWIAAILSTLFGRLKWKEKEYS